MDHFRGNYKELKNIIYQIDKFTLNLINKRKNEIVNPDWRESFKEGYAEGLKQFEKEFSEFKLFEPTKEELVNRLLKIKTQSKNRYEDERLQAEADFDGKINMLQYGYHLAFFKESQRLLEVYFSTSKDMSIRSKIKPALTIIDRDNYVEKYTIDFDLNKLLEFDFEVYFEMLINKKSQRDYHWTQIDAVKNGKTEQLNYLQSKINKDKSLFIDDLKRQLEVNKKLLYWHFFNNENIWILDFEEYGRLWSLFDFYKKEFQIGALTWESIFKDSTKAQFVLHKISDFTNDHGEWIDKYPGKYHLGLYGALIKKGWIYKDDVLTRPNVLKVFNKQFKSDISQRNFQPDRDATAEEVKNMFLRLFDNS